MTQYCLNERDLAFQLFEVLKIERLFKSEYYQDYNREMVGASLDTARKVAGEYFAPFYAKGDQNEPGFDGEKVHLVPEMQAAWDHFAEAGFLAATHDYAVGGMQMPHVVANACMSYFYGANVAFAGYGMLTLGAGNLIRSFGSEDQKARYLAPMLDGRFSGTMALTEAGQGSSLADITTTAELQPDGSYRLSGSKMFISAGDHELSENIIHMVLARIKGAPAGIKGISLFICPKYLVDEAGQVGARNDVKLAGLLHKMGYRQTSSTVLNFGEEGRCEATLVGEVHQGLSYMFQMMNEARIGVGLGATMLGYTGYLRSLDYARERPQGRHPSNKNPESKQLAIIEHADVRRMLLAQKAYVEGSYALCLYASMLVDEIKCAENDTERKKAADLLEMLTPVVKSFPSEYCLEANKLAIQILGGSGYMREYPLEQIYRDNRLNPIHEGTTGIQALDLLGRKALQNNGALYRTLAEAITETLTEAAAHESLLPLSQPLEKALKRAHHVTASLGADIMADPDKGLANASLYLDMMGRIILSWMWLRQAIVAVSGLRDDQDFYQGKLQAARYFIEWELPTAHAHADLLMQSNPVCYEMKDQWF